VTELRQVVNSVVTGTVAESMPFVNCRASIDGLNIPRDFAGQLAATQTIQTNYSDDTTSGQSYGQGSELDQLFVDRTFATDFFGLE
jgi:hypothetical protein